MNYFSIVNDKANAVRVIYDKALSEAEWQSFHPMDNTGSTVINREGVDKIKELCGRDDSNYEIYDFASNTPATGSAPVVKKEEEKVQSKKPK